MVNSVLDIVSSVQEESHLKREYSFINEKIEKRGEGVF